MNNAISIIRTAILLALGMAAMALIFCGVAGDTGISVWTLLFIFCKAAGIGAVFLMVRLYKRWVKIDPWLAAYERMCGEARDEPNPMYIDNED